MVKLLDFIRSPITALVVAFIFAALAPLRGRAGVRAQKAFLWIGAVAFWLRIVLGPEASAYSWSGWFIVAVGTALVLGFVSYYVGQAVEPPLPDDLFQFRHSSLFTPERKKLVTKTLVDFREYLGKLGFEFSPLKLPVGIGQARSTGYSEAAQLGAHHVTLTVEQIDDPMEVTQAYAEYVIPAALTDSRRVHYTSIEFLSRFVIGSDLATYFSRSFWKKKPIKAEFWLAAFWNIRERYGQPFTDDLLAYTVKSFIQQPSPFALVPFTDQTFTMPNKDINRVIYSHLETGYKEVDGQPERWPVILEILEANGLPMEKEAMA